MAGCGASKEQQMLAQKVKARIADCKAIGDKPFKGKGKYVVWDMEKDSLHRAHSLLFSPIIYSSGVEPITYNSGEGLITVFLE